MNNQVDHMASFVLETKESTKTLNVPQSSRYGNLIQQLTLVGKCLSSLLSFYSPSYSLTFTHHSQGSLAVKLQLTGSPSKRAIHQSERLTLALLHIPHMDVTLASIWSALSESSHRQPSCSTFVLSFLDPGFQASVAIFTSTHTCV